MRDYWGKSSSSIPLIIFSLLLASAIVFVECIRHKPYYRTGDCILETDHKTSFLHIIEIKDGKYYYNVFLPDKHFVESRDIEEFDKRENIELMTCPWELSYEQQNRTRTLCRNRFGLPAKGWTLGGVCPR